MGDVRREMPGDRAPRPAARASAVRLPRPRTPGECLGRAVVVGPLPVDRSLVTGAALVGLDLVSFEPGGALAVLEGFDIAVIAVDTDPAHPSDPGSVASAADAVGRFLLPRATVVLAWAPAPLPEQLGPAVVARILEARSGLTAGIDFELRTAPLAAALTGTRPRLRAPS